MNIILLCGGSGQRLWPLSNNVRGKEFVPVLKVAEGRYESMVQRVYRQIRAADPQANVVVATGKRQLGAVRSQLGEGVAVCVEPCRRDTFPAVALAAAYLEKQGAARSEAVIVCPVDHYADDDYFVAICRLAELVEVNNAKLTLMGVKPTHPSTRFGYIIPENDAPVSRVRTFREKPDQPTAARYIQQGALWNCGVFGFKLGYLLDVAHFELDFEAFDDLQKNYAAQTRISFDYAVVEKEPRMAVMRYTGRWKDVGSWRAFTRVMSEPSIGRVQMDPTCSNTHVVNQLSLPIVCMGCEDLLVAASGDGILVSSKEAAGRVQPYVEQLQDEARSAEKSWGSFAVLDVQPAATTVRITLMPGHRLAYHSHKRRDEVWTVIAGSGRAVVDGEQRRIGPGDVVALPAGSRHTILADTPLQVIEVQIGADIRVSDKQKFEL